MGNKESMYLLWLSRQKMHFITVTGLLSCEFEQFHVISSAINTFE